MVGKISFLVVLLTYILSIEALKSFPGNIRYSRNTKYVYLLDSNSMFDEHMQMTLTSEVVIYVLSENDIWQDLHVTINSPTVTWSTEKGEFHDDNYLGSRHQTNWFILRQMSDSMHVDTISYPATQVGKYSVTMLKKSVANVLSVGDNTQKSSHASGVLIKSSEFQLQSGFEKQIEKETIIGRNGEVVNVNVTEVLSARDDKSNKLFHSEMSSHTELVLQKQVPSFNLPPQDSSIVLITESPLATTVPDQVYDDAKLLQSKVIELLQCAMTDEICKQDIVKILKALKTEDLGSLVVNIFELTRTSSLSTDKAIIFLDIISKLSPSGKVNDVIVESVFKEGIPEIVIRKALFHITATALVPSKKSVTKLMSYVVSDNVSKDIQERILLALGSISRNIRAINSTTSSNIAEFLNNILTGHIAGKRASQTYRLSSVLHSIGNAAHDTSIDTIKSTISADNYDNGGLVNTEARLAAIRALSRYPFNEVASTLEAVAESSSHPQIQHASVSTYMKVPNRTKDLSHILKRSVRSKRDSSSNLKVAPKYNVSMPAVNWGLSFGDDNISVDISRNVMNNFDIINDPFNSKYLISIRDESEFSSSLSLSSGHQENNFLQTELCLEGTITYSTNIETSYRHMELSTQFTDFQAIVNDLILEFESAYEYLAQSKALFSDVKSDFSSGLTSTNTKLQEASNYLQQFAADCKDIEDHNGLKTRALELATYINNSYITAIHELEQSQQDLIDLLDIILPGNLEEFFTALLKDSQPFTTQSELVPYLRYAPQTALTGIYEIYWKSGNVLEELKTSINDFVKVTSKFGPHSNWTNPYLTLWSMKSKINELIVDIELEEEHAVDTGADTSNYQALSMTITDNLKPSLDSLVSSPSAVHSTVSSLSSAINSVQSGYNKFTKSYEYARSTVDKIFGQTFYSGFPNKVRPCTEDLGCGSYPSTSGDLFRAGIDLVHSADDPIPAPYSGYISLYSLSNSSYTQNNSIMVMPTEFSMDSIYFVISNIEPHHMLSNTPLFMKAGEIIGSAKPFNSEYAGIHVEAYKTLGSVTHSIDPTQFVAPVLKPTATVDWDCNEITTIVNGMVVETQDFASTNPKMELIGDPLISIDINDEEFPQPYDLILERTAELSSTEEVEFFQSSTFLMVGVIPVTFGFHSYGQYSVDASMHTALLSRNMDIKVTPEVWGKVQGSMRVGDAIYALVDIDGSLLNVSLPLTINQNAGSWPLSAGSNMDLRLHPTSLNLTTKLMQRDGSGDLASEIELESDIRWSYSIPDVDLEDEFDYISTYSDPTPPVFLPLEYSNNSLCHIQQLSGRDYFNPAFELEFSVNEAEGLSNVQAMIGTQENVGNALSKTVIHGERLVLPSPLSNEKDTVVTLIATNRDGLQSSANCILSNYDLSPPQARIIPYSEITSHPNKFEVLLTVFDEYGLEDYIELGVGTAAGLEGGNNIVDWIKLDVELINQNKGNFSFPRSGRLIENVLSMSNEVYTNDECRLLCLAESSCLSYDYSESQERCILHSSIEGPPSSDEYLNTFETLAMKASDDFVHYEALGRGNSTVYVLSDLSLDHGQEFYINMVLHNKLGFSNVVSSSSVLVDLTPPTPGRVRNTNETLVMKECGELLNILHKCEGETTTVNNHRVIYDGSGSHTVFNGPTPFIDALYTKASSFISANWDRIEDRESGLYAYTWCISSNTNHTCDVYGPANPHGSNSEQVYWTNTGLATFSDELEDGDYYITVDAINNAVYGGAMVTTIHHTTPYTLDTTPPVVQHLTVNNYDIFNNILTLNVSVSDLGSGIKEVAVSVGTTVDNTAILDWSPIHMTHSIVNVSVTIPDGGTGWVKLRAINNVDLQSLSTSSLPIDVDRSPPTAGHLYDGSVKGVDAMYQSSDSEICLNWEGVVDTHSGIVSLKWGIGTSPGTYDVLPLQNVTDEETAAHVVCATSLGLSHGVSYYSTLIATNGADLETTISSNGVTVDTSDPIAGVVRDGSSVDIKYSHSLTTLEANWGQFSDAESGIAKYTVTVYQKISGSDTAGVVLTKDNIETTSYYGNQFHFSNGDIIHVEVTAFNGASLSVKSSSDGYTIDLTAPEVMTLSDGSNSLSDLDYFSNSSYSFNWVAFDYESDVSAIELTLYQLTGGKKTKVYPVLGQTHILDDTSLTKYTIDDIEFTHGMKYKAKLILTNGAGLKSFFETDGAIADFVPPTMESTVVFGDTLLYNDDDVLDDDVLQLGNNREVDASWYGHDDGSGIMEFIVCVVNADSNVPSSGCSTFDKDAASGTVTGLNLTVGTEDSGPFYKVQVTAVDYVGLHSQPIYSDIFWISGEEYSGTVYDGFSPFEDIDYTYEMSSISTYFSGFISHQCGGIVDYQWAIGQNTDDKTSILSFTDYGLTVKGNGSGYAQLPLHLNGYQSEELYITVQGITGCGHVMESTSNGFIIDSTPPVINILETSHQAIENISSKDVYQTQTMFSSVWKTMEDSYDSSEGVTVRIGSYPGGVDFKNETEVNGDHIRENIEAADGVPSYVTVSMTNKAGLQSIEYSSAVVLDTSPPEIEFITCSMSSSSVINCDWNVHDPESGIDHVLLSLSSDSTDQSRITHTELSGSSCSVSFDVSKYSTELSFYVVLYAYNNAGLETITSSTAVYSDTTPPINDGMVYVIPNFGEQNYTDNSAEPHSQAPSAAAVCIWDTDVIQLKFPISYDHDSEVSEYKLAIGWIPSDDSVAAFHQISVDIKDDEWAYYNIHVFDTIKSISRRPYYFTIRSFNDVGLYSDITSVPVYFKSDETALPSWVYDGDSSLKDREYQAFTDVFDGNAFFGVNCPMKLVEWSIEGSDGIVIKSFMEIDVNDNDNNSYTFSTDQVTYDNETYRITVRGIDYSGQTHVIKSNGLIVTKRQLLPGIVREGVQGLLPLSYQESSTSLLFYFEGFGDGTDEQEIEYFEVALGSDKEHLHTRSDIVSFTNIGLAMSHEFVKLDLISQTQTYFTTVRAHAVSGAVAEASSNGIIVGLTHAILPGEIHQTQFQYNTTYLSAYWDGFESNVPITKYEWALGSVPHSDTFLQSMCEDRTNLYESEFDVFDFVDLETSTYGYADGLSLQHGVKYYVVVRVTDQSDMCITVISKVPTVVDTTPPIANDITIGVKESRLNLPIEDEYIAYLLHGSSLTVSWRNFTDVESGIKSYEIGIFKLEKCSPTNLVESGVIVEYIDAGLMSEFTFENINLDSNVSYTAKVKATNNAGLPVTVKSNPVLVDTYELSAGQVKDGTDWKEDLVFQSDRTKLSGILALSYNKPNPDMTTPCPSNRLYSFTHVHDDWSNAPFTEFNGLKSSALEYMESNAEINDSLTITARFSPGNTKVVSGVYHALLNAFSGRESISLMVRPAKGDASLVNYTVTSLLILDSSNDELLVEYDPSVVSESSDEYKALGLQIHSDNGTDQHKLILWSKESAVHSKAKAVSKEIVMNSSIAHKVELDFYYEMHGLYMKTKVEVRIDDILMMVLHDIPQFKTGAKFILHVFNREGYIPFCAFGCANPPAVTASFHDISLPTELNEVCQYGVPFHSWGSPIVQIKGGIGTSTTSADIKPLEVVHVPCRACPAPSTPCYSYGCDKTCPLLSDPHTLSFSFNHISLMSDNDSLLDSSGSGSGDDNRLHSDVIGYFQTILQPSMYYIIVEATTASGQTIHTSSNGILIDITPPVQSVPIHLYDVEFSLTQSSSYQGNNHTISATWGFQDLESGIVSYSWSIGTKPYGQEIQEYVSVGMQTHATNSSLQGLLLHNETYYVTVKAVNGAGLSSVVTSSGITHLSIELNETELNNGIIITSSKVVLDTNNRSLYIVSSEENVGVIITTNVEDVDKTSWGLGSHIDPSYDIFPLTAIGQGVTASVDHNLFYVDNVPHGNVSDILALSDGVSPSDISGLFIEPGRVFYHTVEFCDLAHSCITSSPRQAMFLRSHDITLRSLEGDDLNFTMTQLAPVPDVNTTLNITTLDSNHTVSIATTGGLQKGTWVFAGFLAEEDVTLEYHVDIPYIRNPYSTMDQTSRELARRFSSIGGPSFFVSFFGQESLNGELVISTTFNELLNWTTSVPRLAYWDIDNNEWREVEDTCGSQTTAVNWTTYTLSVEVCSTVVDGVDITNRPSSLARRRRNIDLESSGSGDTEDEFLERPVQFIVIERGNVSANTPPKLVIESPVMLTEDTPFTYQILYEDAEDDDVLFYITSVPKLGVATVDADTGVLTYTPCNNCIGYDTLEIYIQETNLKFGRELDATGLLQLHISNVDDPLISFLFENTSSNSIWSSDNIKVYVEANRTEPVTIAKVGAYDLDGYKDDMEVYVTGASAGSGGYTTWLDVVAVPESLPVNWIQDSIASFNGYIAFLGVDITYVSGDPEYTGDDLINIYAQQEDTVTSSLRIDIEVIPSVCLNNGVCNGSSTDPDCTDINNRINNPADYTCKCPDGYSGLYCQNKDTIEEISESQCPGNIPVVDCGGNPCEGAVCPGYRDTGAVCVPDYCGHCHAAWYLDNEVIQCSASEEDVCFQPIIPGLSSCIGVSCDCPSEPYECPQDSIYIETRVGDCCVEYSCVCPDISCPLLMDSSKNVYPHPEYRGGQYPGRCCPNYAYTDINECADPHLHMCSDDCINTDLSYSCGCEDGVTLASNGHTCGVCNYDGDQYLYGDRVKIGCNWCTCHEDDLSGERWHCTANTCDPNCYYNGTTYSVDSQLALASVSCSCEATDTFAEWTCQSDI